MPHGIVNENPHGIIRIWSLFPTFFFDKKSEACKADRSCLLSNNGNLFHTGRNCQKQFELKILFFSLFFQLILSMFLHVFILYLSFKSFLSTLFSLRFLTYFSFFSFFAVSRLIFSNVLSLIPSFLFISTYFLISFFHYSVPYHRFRPSF